MSKNRIDLVLKAYNKIDKNGDGECVVLILI
jgi:hypothetical protein